MKEVDEMTEAEKKQYEVIKEAKTEEEKQRAFEGLMILKYPWFAEVEDAE